MTKIMEFPEDFNQLELLNSHGRLIPRGDSSLWTEEEEEEEENEEEEHTEEWCLQKEEMLRDRPEELILWAAENSRTPQNRPEAYLNVLSAVHRLVSTDPALVHCRDQDGYTPLHRAAYGGHLAVASAVLAAGSNVNPRTADGWTPLHSACRWGHVAVATLLLHRGAELNAQTRGGLTALHLAAAHTARPPGDSAHTLELLLSQRHLKAELRSGSGETAGEVARRSGPHHFLFEMVEDCAHILPPADL